MVTADQCAAPNITSRVEQPPSSEEAQDSSDRAREAEADSRR
jgi:hypothetical protein